MKLSSNTLMQIELATRRAYPEEMCGWITTEGNFSEQPNISRNDKTKSFELCPLRFLENRYNIVAIVHSHTGNYSYKGILHPQTPSLADLELAETYKIPLLISALVNGTYLEPIQVPPEPSSIYINRPYIFGVSDCGILIRDFYHYEFNIDIKIPLTDHLTEKSSWEDLVKRTLEGNNLSVLNLSNQNKVASTIVTNELLDITQTGKLQKGDLLITSILGFFNNHAMIYLGNNMLLNQREISQIEPLELYLNKITKVYRHPAIGAIV